MTRGGKREGAGRKADPVEGPRIAVSLRLAAGSIELVKQHQAATGLPTFTAALESLIALGHLADAPARLKWAIAMEGLTGRTKARQGIAPRTESIE